MGQILAENFQQLSSGVINLQDPGGNKILAEKSELETILDKFYDKFPNSISALKTDFQNYINLLQLRNAEVVRYNQLLTQANKEIVTANKADMIKSTINNSKFKDTDPALPEIANYMRFIYNHARGELLQQLYHTSRAFDFWSVTKTNTLSSGLNSYTPEQVDSYVLQGINLDLENNFANSPGIFKSPPGSFKGSNALEVTLTDFEVQQLTSTNSAAFSIPIPAEGAFYGRTDVRLTQVSVTLELKNTPTTNQNVLIDVEQLGNEKVQNTSSKDWYTYQHSAVVVECGYGTKSGAVTSATLESTDGTVQLANIGPYATWRVIISAKKNPDFDITQVKSVALAFEGTYFDTVSVKDKQ